MKKIIALSLLGISLCFANECPDLSTKENNTKFKQELITKMSNLNYVYTDILETYNSTEDVDVFIGEKSFQELSKTYTWTKLTEISYKILDQKNKPQRILEQEEKVETEKYFNREALINLQKEYLSILTKIKPENKNWCTEEGLK